MLAVLVRLLRIASIAICSIVLLAFIVFAANQTKTASNTQQEQIAAVNPTGPAQPASTKGKSHESAIHEKLDEVSNSLTSPFAGVVSGSSSEWVTRGVKLLLSLLVYGFGLGFVARSLRVRQ